MAILDDYLTGSGAKAFFSKETPVGASVTGKVKDVRVEQATDPATSELQAWPDGNPKNRAVIIIQTDLREPSADGRDDNGERAIYIKLWGVQKKALTEASTAAGGSPAPGDTLTVAFTGLGPQPSNKLFSPAKLYTYTIVKGNALADALNQPAPATATATAAPAATAPATSTAGPVDVVAQVRTFVNLGVTDDEAIARTISVDVAAVQAARLVIAGGTGAGF